ncbi:sensor histidine kinase [Loigolactobacillus binensis]|uniref:histidine kinase n=1 Tax=Loigolactobacillus binensis TaxID=2559922 RepID=A0ABW3EBW7_9LACO|nr:HAMP domain-containing sensor histidine kinase [Loigolactobacillus binensis]
MKKVVNHKQQIRLFITELISFAIIFISLGTIVYLSFQHEIYRNVDQGLEMKRSQLLLNQFKSNVKSKNNVRTKIVHKQGTPPPDFRVNFLIYDSKGKVTNTQMLGDIYSLLSNIKLKRQQRGKIVSLTTDDGSKFRSLLVKVPASNTSKVYAGRYVQIIQNIDSEDQAIQSFRRILILTMLFFWLLSILLSYFLSRWNMKPILKSWQQQQDFVANAAHELRTPLTIIQSKMELLLTKPNEKIISQMEPIALSLAETRRLNQLTRDLLMLARSDSNMTQVTRQPTQMKSFLEQVIAPYSEIAASQDKTFTAQIDLDNAQMIDQKRIHQLLVILLDNALKYTQTGDQVQFKAQIHGNHWQVEVADTGIGIAPENRKAIFQRFYREDKSHSRHTGGNGLGLAIAKWIIDSHQGTVKVLTNEPHGSRFVLSFPIEHIKEHHQQ